MKDDKDEHDLETLFNRAVNGLLSDYTKNKSEIGKQFYPSQKFLFFSLSD